MFRASSPFITYLIGLSLGLIACLPLSPRANAQSSILLDACNNIENKVKRLACLKEVVTFGLAAKVQLPQLSDQVATPSKEEECLASSKHSFKDPDSVKVLKNLGGRGQVIPQDAYFWLRYSATNSYGGRVSANMACKKGANGWARDLLWESEAIANVQIQVDAQVEMAVENMQSSVTSCNKGNCFDPVIEAGRKAAQRVVDREVAELRRESKDIGRTTVWQDIGDLPSPKLKTKEEFSIKADQSARQLVDLGSGVLKDGVSGAVWRSTDNGRNLDWQSAIDWCKELGNGWSLPTIAELGELYAYSGNTSTRCGSSECSVSKLFQLSASKFWSETLSIDPSKVITFDLELAMPLSVAIKDEYARALCIKRSQ